MEHQTSKIKNKKTSKKNIKKASPKTSKKPKVDITTDNRNNTNEPTSSKNFLAINKSPQQAKNEQKQSGKTPWRPLKLKKKKN